MNMLAGAYRWLARRPVALLVPGVLIYALCRIPSFFEPHWYTDEAGYATTAREWLRGLTLYSQAWTNKPPVHIWIVAATYTLFGPSEAGFHAVTFLSGLLALLALYLIARQFLTPPRVLIACLAFGIALGLPLFDAELLLPESLLIAPTTWAAWMVLTLISGAKHRSRPFLLAIGAGALAAVAVGIQQTALADASALGLILALAVGMGRRLFVMYAAAFAIVVAAWLLPAVAAAGLSSVAFALVGFYQGYAAWSTPTSPPALVLRALGPALALLGAFTARNDARSAWPLWLWACADLSVSAIANRPYAHYLAPALASVILALLSVRRLPMPVLARLAPLAAAFVLTVPAALVAGTDFKAVIAYATWPVSSIDPDGWSQQLDVRTTADEQAAAWIRGNGLSGSKAVVWSSSPWVYLLADLSVNLPAPPIYNDVVLLGSGAAVVDEVLVVQPDVIVTSTEGLRQWPEIKRVLEADYEVAFESDPDTVYVRKTGGT